MYSLFKIKVPNIHKTTKNSVLNPTYLSLRSRVISILPILFHVSSCLSCNIPKYQIMTHTIITLTKINNKSFLSSQYPSHVKLFPRVSKISFKFTFQICIPVVPTMNLIDLLRSRSLTAGGITALKDVQV